MDNKNHTAKYVGIGVIVVLVLIGIGVLIAVLSKQKEMDQAFVPGDTASWETHTDDRVAFQYPESIPAGYVTLIDWPPQVQVLGGDFSCTEAGNETDRAGATREKTISGRAYCITKVTDSDTAGTMYTQYAYGTEVSGTYVMMTFSARMLPCDSYEGATQNTCDREQKSFDVDAIASRIAETIVIK
jgi:hypothetical protein